MATYFKMFPLLIIAAGQVNGQTAFYPNETTQIFLISNPRSSSDDYPTLSLKNRTSTREAKFIRFQNRGNTADVFIDFAIPFMKIPVVPAIDYTMNLANNVMTFEFLLLTAQVAPLVICFCLLQLVPKAATCGATFNKLTAVNCESAEKWPKSRFVTILSKKSKIQIIYQGTLPTGFGKLDFGATAIFVLSTLGASMASTLTTYLARLKSSGQLKRENKDKSDRKLEFLTILTSIEQSLLEHDVNVTACSQRVICRFVKESVISLRDRNSINKWDKVIVGAAGADWIMQFIEGTPVEEAIKAGREGRHCVQTFKHCKLRG